MLEKAQAIQENIFKIRRQIHQHPELSYKESETARTVMQRLDELGVYYRSGIAKTGIVAEISKNGTQRINLAAGEKALQPIIIVRADMDALPIQEDTDLPFASKIPGIMHACGHDTHTAMVLGVVELLKDIPFKGSVRFLFQPAEEGASDDKEGYSGARRMIMEGVCEGVSAALGLHQIPTMKTGYMSIKASAIMAAAEAFKIEVIGKASHAGASPELGIDAIAISAQLINAVHQIISRNVSPHDTAVISISTIHAGSASNVIADKATMHGTMRTVNEKTREKLKSKLKNTCDSIAKIHDTEIHFDILESIPLTMNNARIVEICKLAAAKIIPAENIVEMETVMGAEDFAFYAQTVPSCFVLLGSRVESGPAHSIHNAKMIVNENALPIGTAYFAQATLDLLEQFSK